MRRKDNFSYHAIIRHKEKGKIPKSLVNCPNQGRRFPKDMLRCPICKIRLRRRKRGGATTKKHSEIITLTYLPKARIHESKASRHEAILFLIERIPQIRERMANIVTDQTFRTWERKRERKCLIQ